MTLTYGNWLWSALGSAVALGVDPGERWLCCLPVAHVGGLSILMRSAIYGTTAVVHERFDAGRVLEALRDPAGPTLVSLVPATLTRLLDAGLREPPALRWALLGGRGDPGRADRTGGGGGRAGGADLRDDRGVFADPHERRAALLHARRVDDTGEILVRGPTVSPDAGPVLRTGDLGRVGADGRVAVLGRADDVIISGGENVAPSAVEQVLEQHPDVAEAVVHGRPDEEWGQVVVATLVLTPGRASTSLRSSPSVANGSRRGRCRRR